MRILILGSVAAPVPPPMQGGTERIAYYQAVGLADRGHDVTLIGAKGSKKSDKYKLVVIGGGDTVVRYNSEQNSKIKNQNSKQEITESSRKLRKETVYLTQVAQWMIDHKNEYDMVINNMRGGESIFLMVAGTLGKKVLNVMHLPIFSELAELFDYYKTPIITISNAQRRNYPDLNYVGTVYNCLDIDEFIVNETPEDYLLMMGSIAPHKNQGVGIRVAKKVGLPIKIAGKIGNKEYFESKVKPFIGSSQAELIGEIGMEEKVKLYNQAKALLFPIDWEEPFGLVMIEAMACGTPVVAFNRGAVSEVVIDGKTGFIVENEDQMVEAVNRIDEIDRLACRKYVEENFTIEKMIDSLEKAIEKVYV